MIVIGSIALNIAGMTLNALSVGNTGIRLAIGRKTRVFVRNLTCLNLSSWISYNKVSNKY